MNPVSILLLGFAMSTDAFAAAIGKGSGIGGLRSESGVKFSLENRRARGLGPANPGESLL